MNDPRVLRAGLSVNLHHFTSAELLALHAQVAEELRSRGVVRSANNPAGDVAEKLFCKAFGWNQAGDSNQAVDAAGDDGTLYQIKARRMTPHNRSRQLSGIRNLTQGGFDFLAAVLFAPDYSVARAAIIPHNLVVENATEQVHTNSWIFILRKAVWTWPGVEDATEALRAVSL